MATAHLTSDLLARKGGAHPTRKWLREPQLIVNPAMENQRAKQAHPAGKQITKSLRINTQLNQQLKLFAVRSNQSQQAIMEKAVGDYLAQQLENAECICGADE
jgi:hypothetical protein